MKKVVRFFLMTLMLVSLVACSGNGSNSNAVVVFNDDVLESMIRTAMEKPEGDILVSDALAITEFDFRMDGNDWSLPRINNLDALKYFTNLTKLDLSWALQNGEDTFADVEISGLSTLTNLEYLQLACVNVSDISPLSNLTSLKGLVLWGDKRIEDISPLASLTNLEAVELKNNFIGDLTPLAGLSKLNYVDVSNNIIVDVSPLAGLSNLKELYVSENLISDYTPLSGISSNLEKRDFEPVAKPQPIDFKDAVLEQKVRQALNIPAGDITINDTKDITELNFGNSWEDSTKTEMQISDISGLKYFPNLFKLELFFNNIEWIDVVRGLPNLGFLDLNGNKVSDIAGLSRCPNLVALNLSGCKCYTQGLAPLATLTRLESLDLSFSPAIGSVEVLSGMTSLQSLNLTNTPVDLSPLAGLTKLKTLYLAEPLPGKYEPNYLALKEIYPNLTEKNFEMPSN